MKYAKFSSYLLPIIAPLTGLCQVTVDNNNSTVEQYVQNILIGSGVSVSNIQFNGGSSNITNEQLGSFQDNNGLTTGLNSGFIMGSGDVQLAGQSNTSNGATLGGSGLMGSDFDLQSITSNQIYDECVIEFDFIPEGDSISFNYVFVSEEYPVYVCASFNDAFGFFLTGPNPNGPNYNAENIALIPNPNNPSTNTEAHERRTGDSVELNRSAALAKPQAIFTTTAEKACWLFGEPARSGERRHVSTTSVR